MVYFYSGIHVVAFSKEEATEYMHNTHPSYPTSMGCRVDTYLEKRYLQDITDSHWKEYDRVCRLIEGSMVENGRTIPFSILDKGQVI